LDKLHKSEIYAIHPMSFTGSVVIVRLFKSLKATSANKQFGAMPFGTLRQAAGTLAAMRGGQLGGEAETRKLRHNIKS